MASKRKVLFIIILLAAAALAVFFLYSNREKIGKIITPFLMAIVLAYLLTPLVKRLEMRKIPRHIGILLLYLGFFLISAVVMVFLIPELINNTKELLNTLPDITTRYQTLFNNFTSSIKSSAWSDEIKGALYNEIQNVSYIAQGYIASSLKKLLSSVIDAVSAVLDLLLALVIAYYFIKDGDFFKNLVLSLVPRRWRNGITGSGREINLILSNFIQGQLLVAVIVGILEAAGLWIFKIKYALVLGLVGGAANVIPYFGPVIGAVPAVAVAIIDSPVKALKAIIVFAIIQQLDNSFISPKVIEGRLGLHPVTTILAVLVGGEFFGIAGMLLSVPAAAIIKVMVKRAIEAIV